MDDVEIVDDSSSFESDEDEDNYTQVDSSVTHNNNELLLEQQVLSTQEVFLMMERQMKEVMDITALSANKVRSLLNDFKWDTNKLIETYYEDVKKSHKLMENTWNPNPVDVRKIFDCEICFDTVLNPANIQKLQCNHRFCVNCLSDYVSLTIKEGGGLLTTAIRCPGYECSYELDDEAVLQTLEDSSLKRKYQQIVANCFVQNNRFIKWCPNVSCENAVRLESCPAKQENGHVQLVESVHCLCGYWFCFLCHRNSHDPVPCEMLAQWSKVRSEDLEVQQWILKHTKPCPGCHSNIEKQGGCMHMTCSKCRHQFCWVCMGQWAHHHNCNHNDTVNRPAEDFQCVRRFATYNAKHETMKQSYELDVAQYKHKMVQGKELELDKQIVKIDDIAQAVELLLQCRRTLMHSYIFSYFMTTIDNQMYIFEENLKYLEQCTEQLSEALENEVTAENFKTTKALIVDVTALCSNRRRDLLNHIREGYEMNWWRKFPIPSTELVAAELRLGDAEFQRLLY